MRYAYFDSAVPAPQPVRGWYDAAMFEYGDKLPPSTHLIELTDTQWDNRLSQPWSVENGTLVPTPPPAAAPVYIRPSTIRERLTAAGKWDVAAAALFASPSDLLWFTTLDQGVFPDDAHAIALLTGIGADAAVILAP